MQVWGSQKDSIGDGVDYYKIQSWGPDMTRFPLEQSISSELSYKEMETRSYCWLQSLERNYGSGSKSHSESLWILLLFNRGGINIMLPWYSISAYNQFLCLFKEILNNLCSEVSLDLFRLQRFHLSGTKNLSSCSK
jgi:hypothetical protein